MSYQLLYKHGLLTPHQVDCIRSALLSEYQNILFVSALPPWEWINKTFEQFPSTGEDCMGNEYKKMTQMWSLIHVPGGRLWCLRSRKDYDAVLLDYADLVIDASPLEQVLQVPKIVMPNRVEFWVKVKAIAQRASKWTVA